MTFDKKILLCLLSVNLFVPSLFSNQVIPSERSLIVPKMDGTVKMPEQVYRKRETTGGGMVEAREVYLQKQASVQVLPDSLSAEALYPQSNITETNITLLLSYDEPFHLPKLEAFSNESEKVSGKGINFRDASIQALDFTQGFLSALNLNEPMVKVNLNIVDITSSDSLLREMLSESSVMRSNVIIGPNRGSAAKIVSDFCKKNKILNIQPFISSLSLPNDNPYLIRLSPTIEAHMARMYETIADSFSQAKIIIVTSKRDRDMHPALFLDSLLNRHNATEPNKIFKVLVNTGDNTKPVLSKDVSVQIDPKRLNVIVYCSYEASVVNLFLRSINKNDKVVVFGMPTWKDDEIIRADYLNSVNFHFTDLFYERKDDSQDAEFRKFFFENFAHIPSEHAFLGNDVANYLSYSLKLYGYNFPLLSIGTEYKGLGFNFRLNRSNAEPAKRKYSSYKNDFVNQFSVTDYEIRKID